jgi:hypothetical protein
MVTRLGNRIVQGMLLLTTIDAALLLMLIVVGTNQSYRGGTRASIH